MCVPGPQQPPVTTDCVRRSVIPVPRRRSVPRRLTPARLAVGGGLALAVAAGAFFAGRNQGATDIVATVPAPAADATTRPDPVPGTITLFYVAEGGLSLVARQEDLALNARHATEDRARIVVERQLGPAPEPLASPFPAGTRLRGLYVSPGGEAFVDLSNDAARGHGGGSLDELLTVYAIVNAVAVNVPEVSAVQILIDGREVDTLAGHVDLRRPLEPDLRWVS